MADVSGRSAGTPRRSVKLCLATVDCIAGDSFHKHKLPDRVPLILVLTLATAVEVDSTVLHTAVGDRSTEAPGSHETLGRRLSRNACFRFHPCQYFGREMRIRGTPENSLVTTVVWRSRPVCWEGLAWVLEMVSSIESDSRSSVD